MDFLQILADPTFKGLGSFGLAAAVAVFFMKKSDTERKERETEHKQHIEKQQQESKTMLEKAQNDFKDIMERQRAEFKESLENLGKRKDEEATRDRETYEKTMGQVCEQFEFVAKELTKEVQQTNQALSAIKYAITSLQTSQELFQAHLDKGTVKVLDK